MRRTNILLEFSDDVYDTLVEPLKKNRSFTRLVTTLINGYMQDGYIKAYADDTLDEMRSKAVSSFNDSIASMNETLAEMGLVTDELEATAVGGRDLFKEKAKQAVAPEQVRADGGISLELSAVNARIDKVQETVQSMVTMLSSLVQTGFIKKSEEDSPIDEGTVPQEVSHVEVEDVPQESAPESESLPKQEVADIEKEYEVNEVDKDNDDAEDVSEEVSEDADMANSFLASMLSGNAFEY